MPIPPVFVYFYQGARTNIIAAIPKSKSRSRGAAFRQQRRSAALLDLAFFEDDMLARDRIILLELELFGLGARVFLRDVEVTRIGRAHELDLDCIALCHRTAFPRLWRRLVGRRAVSRYGEKTGGNPSDFLRLTNPFLSNRKITSRL